MRMVQLLDGRLVGNATEEWRHECEARHIAALPTVDDRRAWLEAIARRRGAVAADALRATLQQLWKRKAA